MLLSSTGLILTLTLTPPPPPPHSVECYVPLEEKLKRVMEQELRVIVQEEK